MTTFTVSKWDEKLIDDTRKDFPINIAHVEYDIDGELKGKAFVEYLVYYFRLKYKWWSLGYY